MVPSFGISPLKVATQHELLVQADTRIGTACASAPRITSAVRWQGCTRPFPAGRGGRGWGGGGGGRPPGGGAGGGGVRMLWGARGGRPGGGGGERPAFGR